MPIVRIEIFEGRSVEKKRELAEGLTAETMRVLDCARASVNVIIDEVKQENWAVGGKLYSDQAKGD